MVRGHSQLERLIQRSVSVVGSVSMGNFMPPMIIVKGKTCDRCRNSWDVVEDKYCESVTIVRRQRFEGGFHIRTKLAGVSLLTPPGGQIQDGRQQNNCLAFNDPTQQIRYLNISF